MFVGAILGITICILFVLLLRSFFVVAIVKQESMTPTLKNGDALLVIRWWPIHWLRRGQIVLIQPPYSYPGTNSNKAIPYIKRIVGLPGDTNLLPNVSQYTQNDIQRNRPSCIPPGHFFVQGDNINSEDSRTWGAISFDRFLGLVIMKLPPSNETEKTK